MLRWGGLLAAVASAEDFDKAREDDPDIKQMVDTVQRLEASLVDCAVHGLDKVVDTFAECQLTPAILNRWNSPVLDGLWQAVTGRTPDGVTPFALNPPVSAKQLLDRLVWPKAYPAAVDLLLRLMNVAQGPENLLISAMGTAACCNHVEILRLLLQLQPHHKVANLFVVGEIGAVGWSGHVRCLEELIAHGIISFDKEDEFSHRILGHLLHRLCVAGHLPAVTLLLSRHSFSTRALEKAALGCLDRPIVLAQHEEIFNNVSKLISTPSPDFMELRLIMAAVSGRVLFLQEVLTLGFTPELLLAAANACLTPARVPCLQVLLSLMNTEGKVHFVSAGIRIPAESGDIELCRLMLDAVRHQAVWLWQMDLDHALLISVSQAHIDPITLFLQYGANARDHDDYTIFLAAVSGRVDVMELLLGAADVDAECAARYRQQMIEPAGLLGVAQGLLSAHMTSWRQCRIPTAFFSEGETTPLNTALIAGNIPAVRWLLDHPAAPALLASARPVIALGRSGNIEALQVLLQSHSIRGLSKNVWSNAIQHGLAVARAARLPDMIRLLHNEWVACGKSFSLDNLQKALECNDPLCREYAAAPFPVSSDRNARSDILTRYSLIMSACMLTDLALLQDVVALCRRVFPKLQDDISASLERAVQLCTAEDMTPVMMLMLDGSHGSTSVYSAFSSGAGHPVLLAALSGNVSAVKLWLAKGVNVQVRDNEALKRAVQYRHRAVAALLLSNGADPNALSPADRVTLRELC